MKKNKYPEDYFEGISPDKVAILQKVRDYFAVNHHDIKEVMKYNMIFYINDTGNLIFLGANKKGAYIGLFHGFELYDPANLLDGKGTTFTKKLFLNEGINFNIIKEFIEQIMILNSEHLANKKIKKSNIKL